MTTATRMTGEELLALPRDGQRFELIEGELIEMAPAGADHCGYNADIASDLVVFVRKHKLGKVLTGEPGFYLSRDPDTVRAPDVAFLTWERWNAQARTEAFLEGAPDLAVEVVSPGDRYNDVQDKALAWLEAGARLVWVVEPRSRRVTIYLPDGTTRRVRDSETLDGGDVLPGFALALRDLFA